MRLEEKLWCVFPKSIHSIEHNSFLVNSVSLKVHFFMTHSATSKLIGAFLIVAFIVVVSVISYYALTNQSAPNSSPKPTFSSEPITPPAMVTPTSMPSPTLTASPTPHATVKLQVTDIETGKFVDSVPIFVDGKDIGTTTQNGELEIENLEYGRHKISIDQYHEQEINVSGDMTLSIIIDMPNSILEATINVKADYITFRELGRISITLSNTGQIASQNTIALVFIYVEPDLEAPATNRTVDFGNIEVDMQPVTKEIVGIDSFVWPNVERVAVVIIDQSKYIPEDTQVLSQEPTLPWFITEIQDHTHAYIKEHPEITGTITRIILTR